MPEGANRAKPAASATSRLTIIALLCIDVLLMATHAHSATFTLPTPGRTANGEKTRRRAARMMVLPEVGALQIGETPVTVFDLRPRWIRQKIGRASCRERV